MNIEDEVNAELNDRPNSLHGASTTYRNGCRGPLCRKNERDRRRILRHTMQPDVRTRGRSERDNDEYLESVEAKHAKEYYLLRNTLENEAV